MPARSQRRGSDSLAHVCTGRMRLIHTIKLSNFLTARDNLQFGNGAGVVFADGGSEQGAKGRG